MVEPFTLTIVAPGDPGVNVRSLGRHLKAENLSERTKGLNLERARRFVAFLEAQAMLPTVAALRRARMEARDGDWTASGR